MTKHGIYVATVEIQARGRVFLKQAVSISSEADFTVGEPSMRRLPAVDLPAWTGEGNCEQREPEK